MISGVMRYETLQQRHASECWLMWYIRYSTRRTRLCFHGTDFCIARVMHDSAKKVQCSLFRLYYHCTDFSIVGVRHDAAQNCYIYLSLTTYSHLLHISPFWTRLLDRQLLLLLWGINGGQPWLCSNNLICIVVCWALSSGLRQNVSIVLRSVS